MAFWWSDGPGVTGDLSTNKALKEFCLKEDGAQTGGRCEAPMEREQRVRAQTGMALKTDHDAGEGGDRGDCRSMCLRHVRERDSRS